MSYKIKFAARVEKYLTNLRKQDQRHILEKLETLKKNPIPEGSIKLKGKRGSNLHRIRSGNYRIIYSVNKGELLIFIVSVGDRKDIYRSF